ncbi:MAG: hypothetical protein AAGC55_24110, partial [Myxococcota bacterium]
AASGSPVQRRQPIPTNYNDTSPQVTQYLNNALAVEDPRRRLQALEELNQMSPNQPAVLFHVAIESALAGDFNRATHYGNQLQRVSPERYRQLYQVAETYWPSGDGEVSSANAAPAMAPSVPDVPLQGKPDNRWVTDVHAKAIRPNLEPTRMKGVTLALPSANSAKVNPSSPPGPSPSPSPSPGPAYGHGQAPVPVNVHYNSNMSSPGIPMGQNPGMAPQMYPRPMQPVRGSRSSAGRTALVIVGAVVAGLLFALLAVFLISNIGSKETGSVMPASVPSSAVSIEHTLQPNFDAAYSRRL